MTCVFLFSELSDRTRSGNMLGLVFLSLRSFSNYLRGQFCGTGGVDADELAFAAFVFELDKALDQREQCVVFTTADIVAGLPFGAALACDNVAAENVLAAEFLETEPLCI